MSLFNILAILVTAAALFSYVNHRFLGLPTSIGLMLIALVISLGLIGLSALGIPLEEDAEILLRSIDFDETLLHGMLSFLLFAGSLHININDLAKQKWIISLLATAGVATGGRRSRRKRSSASFSRKPSAASYLAWGSV